jgi:hypothetical protein
MRIVEHDTDADTGLAMAPACTPVTAAAVTDAATALAGTSLQDSIVVVMENIVVFLPDCTPSQAENELEPNRKLYDYSPMVLLAEF